MKLLILGGTLFLGRHLVEAALARGHEVTLFNRGKTNPELYPEVEKLQGDRDGDLSALERGSWDAAVDTSGYVPRVVHASAELLAGRVEHYTFVSSLSVFSPPSKHGLTEGDPVSTLEDPASEDVDAAYGPLKALCERAAENAMPGRVLNLRSGLLVGPHDPTNRFDYWVRRVAKGGDVLAPAPPDEPVQLIDVRDFAEWTLTMAERRETGTFHVTGEPITFEQMLIECRAASGADARFVWVGEDFLLDQGVDPFGELPLWLAPDHNPEWTGFFLADASRARSRGLTFRALCETARDILASTVEPAGIKFGAQVPPAGLDPAKEAKILDAWKARA